MVILCISQRGRVPIPIVLMLLDVTSEHAQDGSVVLLDLPDRLRMVGRAERVLDIEQLAHTQEEAGSELLPVIRQEGLGWLVLEHRRQAKLHSWGVSVEVSKGGHSC